MPGSMQGLACGKCRAPGRDYETRLKIRWWQRGGDEIDGIEEPGLEGLPQHQFILMIPDCTSVDKVICTSIAYLMYPAMHDYLNEMSGQ